MFVRLSPEDVHTSESMGRDTVALCKMMGFKPRLENENQSREEANVLGFKAEFAVARLLGTTLPTINVVTDGGVDLWFNDVSIDVKFTNRRNTGLIFDNQDKFKSRVAILVAPTTDPSVMNIVGWIGRERFLSLAKTKDLGYGKRLVLSIQHLLGIEVFWKRLHECELNEDFNWDDVVTSINR